MAEQPIINVITSQCQPQDEVRFNKWYNEVHIPMLMKYKGVKRVARYKVTREKSEKPRYVAIYQFDSQKDFENFGKSPELAAAIAEMKQSWPQGLDIISRVQQELIKEW